MPGDGAAALASYRASHAIHQRLAASDPGNPGWQRDDEISRQGIVRIRAAAKGE